MQIQLKWVAPELKSEALGTRCKAILSGPMPKEPKRWAIALGSLFEVQRMKLAGQCPERGIWFPATYFTASYWSAPIARCRETTSELILAEPRQLGMDGLVSSCMGRL